MNQNNDINRLNEILSNHGLKVNDQKTCHSYVKYLVELNYKSDIKALMTLKLNIGLALEDENVRVYRDANYLVIEKGRQNSYLYYSSYSTEEWWNKMTGAKILLGLDEDGNGLFTDLSKAPHILISGVRGSGKTNFLKTAIASLISKAKTYPLILDGADQRLANIYRGVPFIYSYGAETNFRKLYDVNLTLRRRIAEINEKGLANISGTTNSPMVVIVNNVEELISQKPDAELLLANLLEFGEKAGIHMILCLENMETGAYTRRLQVNIPVRICFKMKNASQSLIVLDIEGAESLFGKGDMLFLGKGSNKPIRVQSTYFSDADEERYASMIERANRK